MKNIPRKILEDLINKSVSQAIGRHVMGKNYKFPMEILKEKKGLKCNIIFYTSFLRCYCIILIFLTPAVVILIIKSPNFLCAKSMANIEQLKTQVPHLGCEKKKFSLEALILHFQGEDLDESLTMMET